LSSLIAIALLIAAFVASASGENRKLTALFGEGQTTSERLVDQAQQAELTGATARQFALLREAVRLAPDYPLPRWQLGQVEVDGQWSAVEEAQRRAASDPKQDAYRRLRAESGGSLAGQLALARWCQRNGLDEEAQVNWWAVLAMQPANDEALRALGMRLYDGRPMTPAMIAEHKQQTREAKRAIKRWEPRISKWQRAMSGTDPQLREAALEEIRTVGSADSIPAIETVTLGRVPAGDREEDGVRQIALAFVEAIKTMPAHEATVSLLRHAVLSPLADVRLAATAGLKERPPHDYVPLLLDSLAMPIESSFSVTTDRSGCVHYRHSLYRERADADWSVGANYYVMQNVLTGRDYAYRLRAKVLEQRSPSLAAYAAKAAVVARQSANRFSRTAAAVESQVWNANVAAENLNARIIPVLALATGEDFETPKQWWDWWQDNNEYYAGDHSVEHHYFSGTDTRYYGRPYDTVTYVPSCFVKGTPVWTKTGLKPIESVELSDLVLAQDVNTGELAYKPVLGRTVRPPCPILHLQLEGDELLTTRGHPFWVPGLGWRMAKELEDGAILHGVTRSPRLAAIESTGEAEAYNLVVADFNTYFVGKHGILAHDNTPRRPTRSTAVGLASAR
jgi:hypothetical protein